MTCSVFRSSALGDLRDQVVAHVTQDVLRVQRHGHQRRALHGITFEQRLKFLFEYERQLHQRSTSPRTISIVPMQAIRSATRPPFGKLGQRLQIHERRRAHLHAVGLRRAVAHYEVAHFAARRFDALIDLAGRRRKSFGENLEVIDQRFHLRLHLLALRRNDARRVGLDGAFRRNFAHGLANNLQAFAHLRHAHQVPRVAVGFGARGHVEVELLVARVREKLAHVIGHARRPQRWARIRPGRWRPRPRSRRFPACASARCDCG